MEKKVIYYIWRDPEQSKSCPHILGKTYCVSYFPLENVCQDGMSREDLNAL